MHLLLLSADLPVLFVQTSKPVTHTLTPKPCNSTTLVPPKGRLWWRRQSIMLTKAMALLLLLLCQWQQRRLPKALHMPQLLCYPKLQLC